MPSSSQRKSLETALTNYQGSLTKGVSYLKGRGIDLDLAMEWGLGVVESPEPGHEMFRGRLAIPYYNKLGVIGFKFRCMGEHECAVESHVKYMALAGQEVFLFNVVACDTPSDTLHVTEGELDCIVLNRLVRDSVVGVPGSGQWKAHWPAHFKGFDRVIIWPDGDKAGRDMGNRWRKEIQAAEVVNMPTGYDVSRLFVEEGEAPFLKLAGVDDGS
jgi:DNA primase